MAQRSTFRKLLSFFTIAMLLFAPAAFALAGAPADPYADAVDASTSGLILNSANAVGAPDGAVTTVVGIVGQNLTLDLGAGEEGDGNLKVYYSGLTVGVIANVEFLNSATQLLATAQQACLI